MTQLKSNLFVQMLIVTLLAIETIECARNKQNLSPALKQSENTFLQWVLSLITQAPPYTTSVPATSSTTKPTSKLPLTKPPSPSPSPSPTPPPTPSTTSSITSSTTSSTTPTTTKKASTTSTEVPPSPVLDPLRKCPDCVCGVTNTQKKIVGGQNTEVHQYPWMAMLLYGGRFYCAATLINDQFLVTASHCVNGFRIERITVRLLEHDRKMSHFSKIDRKLMNITTHPKYNARTFDNDIAVLKLSEPVELNEVLRPACLPTPGRSFKGEIGIVTGWGAIKFGGPTSDTLQEVQVPIMAQDDCRKTRYGPTRITDNMLCAGYADGQKDSCQGDSGGPLHVIAPGTREHQLAGVVSWGEGCAKAGYPGVYARVNRYGTWIRNLSRNACSCQSEVKKIKYL